MPDLLVAVVGAGRAGQLHAANLTEHVKAAEVSAVVDSDLDAARRVADAVAAPGVFGTLEDALDLVDAVVITTPTFTHAALTVLACSAGKHVFCEKPMGLGLDECRQMMTAAAEAGVVLQIGFMRRFQAEFAEGQRRIAAGDIGTPMVVKSLTRGPGLPPRWAWDIAAGNGMLAEVNSHDFDCLAWLAASKIERVYAETANIKGPSRGVDVDDFYDNAVVAVRFESGCLGTIDGTCPSDYGYDARAEVVGSSGLLLIGHTGGQAVLQINDREIGAVTPVYKTWPDRFGEAYRAEMRAFVHCALTGDAPKATGEHGYRALAAVIAANRSWKEGRSVRIDEIEREQETSPSRAEAVP
jgi:myo-inositol 2-dehydrogenase/D-chiro-inositol 1-dehydrogenase/scyllo-inositol 2-dehydrogenase (NAD+)